MGQLLNRLYNLAKSKITETNYTTNDVFVDNSDDELKKQIDELSRDKRAEHFGRNESRQDTYRQKMTKETAFKILEVSPKADFDEIKKAYRKKILEYHPDRVASLGKDLIETAERKTREINQAYSFLEKLLG